MPRAHIARSSSRTTASVSKQNSLKQSFNFSNDFTQKINLKALESGWQSQKRSSKSITESSQLLVKEAMAQFFLLSFLLDIDEYVKLADEREIYFTRGGRSG